MSIEKELFNEICREAEYAKNVIKKELGLFLIEELNKISISDFSLNCPIYPIDIPIEICFEEYIKRFNDAILERIEILCSQVKFFQYDLVKIASEHVMYEEISTIHCIAFPVKQTPQHVNKKIKTTILTSEPWLLVRTLVGHENNRSVAKIKIKNICERFFKEDLISNNKYVVHLCILYISERIDRILEHIEKEGEF